MNGPDLVAQSTGKPLKSANKNTELHKSCLEMGTLLQTAMILLKCPFIHHISSWRWWFSIIIIERNTAPLVKGQSRHFSHVRLCCDWRAAWASDTTTRSAAVMGRACDSWRSKPLALVSREIIGYSKSNLNTTLLFHSCYFPLQMRNLQDPFTAHEAVC